MYLWLLSLHIIAVICWYAGLFYLPRLFVYHAMATDPATQNTFKTMEYKLLYYIMHPSMLITLLSGFGLLWLQPVQGIWIHIKLMLVLVLVVYQVLCGRYVRAFRENRNVHSHRFYRIFNEVPTLVLIAIVLLVILKP